MDHKLQHQNYRTTLASKVVRGKTCHVSKIFSFQAKQQSLNQKLTAGEQYIISDKSKCSQAEQKSVRSGQR
jgi:hypothetical protein